MTTNALRMREATLITSSLLLIGGTTLGCNSDDADPQASEAGRIVDSFVCPGGDDIVPGINTLMVNGRARTFVADFPSDATAQVGILFSWHGYNQAEGTHRTSSNLNPDGNPELPVIVITPDDVDFDLPVGLDWQLNEGAVEDNVDLQFFEAMVGCLNTQLDVDPNRIYSLGYSAGSVFSSLLHSVYPKLIRAVICISGMWFNDPEQVDLIGLGGGALLSPTWPPLNPDDGGTILLTHGGPSDIAAAIINLEAMAQAAMPFLAEGGRVVIDCPHNDGHVGHPDLGPTMISKFISEHRADEETPYLSGGYAGFPSSCILRLP